MCEEFHVLPADAIAAIDEDIGEMIPRILSLRAYKSVKEEYDNANAEARAKLPKTGLYDLVQEFTFAAAKERMKELKPENG